MKNLFKKNDKHTELQKIFIQRISQGNFKGMRLFKGYKKMKQYGLAK